MLEYYYLINTKLEIMCEMYCQTSESIAAPVQANVLSPAANYGSLIVVPNMEPQQLSLNIDDDIAETQKLLTVATRPIVRDRLIQLLGFLQQVHALRCHFCCAKRVAFCSRE